MPSDRRPLSWVALLLGLGVLAVVGACSSAPEPEPAPVDNTPPPPPPPPARRIVLAIGVDQFASDQIPPNLAAATDATEVAAALGKAGNAIVESHVLLNADATKESVEARFRQIAAMCDDRFDDTVVVYIASCGAPVSMPSGPRIPVGPTRLYVAMSDADPTNLRETCVALDDFSTLWKCQAERVVVILDCGFGRESRSIGLPRIDAAHVQNLVERHTADIGAGPFPERALVFGTEMNEPVRTDVEGRSTFATTLLEALGGAADANHDGRVTLREAVEMVIARGNSGAGGGAPDVSPIQVIATGTGNLVLSGQPDQPTTAVADSGSPGTNETGS